MFRDLLSGVQLLGMLLTNGHVEDTTGECTKTLTEKSEYIPTYVAAPNPNPAVSVKSRPTCTYKMIQMETLTTRGLQNLCQFQL
mmetsp:Transcript_50538/g.60803  ORF Transcript_50538/g.60803 Transcript_50538/m.60803 type:complete len:84 (-) Transcript_50538:65-316(-)